MESLKSGLDDLSARLDSEADARRAREFARALSEARTRLLEVKVNRLALSAYQRKLDQLDSGLEYITARWTASGAPQSEVEVALGDFTEMANFMTLAADRVGNADDLANAIRTAALQTNFAHTTGAAYTMLR